MSLHVTNADYETIRKHGEQAYPNECCGVLIGSAAPGERRVRGVVFCQNIRRDESPRRFEIDPAELVRVQRQARESGMEILGFYHSHPDHHAYPSPTDLEHAHWIGCSYLITSVEQGRATKARSFLLSGTREEDKRFVAESVVVDDQH